MANSLARAAQISKTYRYVERENIVTWLLRMRSHIIQPVQRAVPQGKIVVSPRIIRCRTGLEQNISLDDGSVMNGSHTSCQKRYVLFSTHHPGACITSSDATNRRPPSGPEAGDSFGTSHHKGYLLVQIRTRPAPGKQAS